MRGYNIYLLHIEPPYKHAGHYMGITRKGREVALRWMEHMDANGRGAVLTTHARKAGCQLILARIWRNTEFAMERKLKGRGLAPLCPICRKRRHATRRVEQQQERER